MFRVLLPVDGSASSNRAVEYLIKLAKSRSDVEVHLLNVQPEIMSGEISMYVSVDSINEYLQEQGRHALEPAKKLLDNAGVAYIQHIGVGQVAETVAQYAKEKKCDAVVMGTRGMGSITSLLLGSVATKVIHLVSVPVTLVK
jgi:nucleotide-binding universal stress UspA family protein